VRPARRGSRPGPQGAAVHHGHDLSCPHRSGSTSTSTVLVHGSRPRGRVS
jgi:hypothetical protein